MGHSEIFHWNPLIDISLKDVVVFTDWFIPKDNVKSVVCISNQNTRSSSSVYSFDGKNFTNLQNQIKFR